MYFVSSTFLHNCFPKSIAFDISVSILQLCQVTSYVQSAEIQKRWMKEKEEKMLVERRVREDKVQCLQYK